MPLVTKRVSSSARTFSASRRPQAAPIGRPSLEDLVADRVHDHARVVEVLRDHRLDVALPPLREGERVVERRSWPRSTCRSARPSPASPRRSHASSMARLIGLCALRMALKPAALSSSHAALLGARDRRGAERPVVVVDAGAAQLHGLAVDAQAVLRVELQRPDAEARRLLVDHVAVAVGHGGCDRVQGGRVGAPQRGARRRTAAPARPPLAPGSSGHRRRPGRDHRAVGVADLAS